MDANTKQLLSLFDTNVLYEVPLFQRPYVWNEANNWAPLWEDIARLLDKTLRTGSAHPHFLGAVVLEQMPNPAGSIETRLVIDGQQRFTTIQVLLIVARNLSTQLGAARYATRFAQLVENDESRAETEAERFKLWPTNSDREAMSLVRDCKSMDQLAAHLKKQPELRKGNIVLAYQYFHAQLAEWISGKADDEDDRELLSSKTTEDRIDVLWQVIQKGLQLVVINLTQDDETQVIFETLNARGTELLPADLIKNYLFHRATRVKGTTKADVEKLYAKHWERFDRPFWREHVQQGRIYRPRIDLFINHYLSMMTRDEVATTHLFNEFRAFAEVSDSSAGGVLPVPTTAAEHIAQLALYGDYFLKLFEPGDHHALALFLRRLAAVDTATVYPFLLYAYARLMPEEEAEFDKILAVLESFLMRRLITNFTPKNYNRLFIDLIKAVERAGELTAAVVGKHLAKGTGESTKFPNNWELMAAVVDMPLYDRIARRKVRAVLEALDAYSVSDKAEILAMPENLTIEHIMPQTWGTHWPLPDDARLDPITQEKASARRGVMLNTLGNLTLITGKFNSSLQNAAWATKRPELIKHSKLNLTRYFHDNAVDAWDEETIKKRTEELFLQLVRIWPDVDRPETVES